MTTQTLLSGIMPSGNLHIGNYLGAIKQWVMLQDRFRVFIMIADLHAITTPQEPAELHEKTLELALLLFSCGIDPKKSVVFLQSHIPAHTELAWILNTITHLGELERMTQFKDKQETSGALAGLLNYPVLEASDILLYQPSVVPVGEDQKQHLELARSLARKFNNKFGKTFTIPKALLQKNAARIMGLDNPDKKMSKSAESANNYIALLDSPDEIRRKIKIAVTDSGKEIKYDREQKPAISNLISIYSEFSGKPHSKIEEMYKNKGYADFKKDLADLIIEKLSPIQKRFYQLSKNKNRLLKILQRGAAGARISAAETLKSAKEKMGFIIL